MNTIGKNKYDDNNTTETVKTTRQLRQARRFGREIGNEIEQVVGNMTYGLSKPLVKHSYRKLMT